MIKLLTNTTYISHISTIEDILKNADEAFIAVAFLKMSGIKRLLPYFKKSVDFKIIAGVNFGITDPEALKTLLDYSKNGNMTGYLNKLSSKVIFHPKMYLLRAGKTGYIIIGSANLTNGGLAKNSECSLYLQCAVTDTIWKDAVGQFNQYIKPDQADLLSERIISIYRQYHAKQKRINDLSEPCPDVAANLIYNLDELKSRFEAMDKAALKDDFKRKREHYKEAREVLDVLAGKKHSANKFEMLVEDLVGKKGEPGLWYSNGMFRHKGSIFEQQQAFRSLIKFIKSNVNKSPGYIYSGAKALTDHILGVGPNFIGEIMMTYAPERLANINRNPLTVLREKGKADIKSHSSSFSGADYQEYNSIVADISLKLGLKDMLEADYFFNIIYQEITRDQ